jgi:hypothetical protein
VALGAGELTEVPGSGGSRPKGRSGKGGAKKGLELDILQPSGLQHGFFEGILDDNYRGPNRFLVVSRVSRKVTEEGAEGFRSSRIVLEFQVDIPKTTLMADGRKVMALGRRGRRLFVG